MRQPGRTYFEIDCLMWLSPTGFFWVRRDAQEGSMEWNPGDPSGTPGWCSFILVHFFFLVSEEGLMLRGTLLYFLGSSLRGLTSPRGPRSFCHSIPHSVSRFCQSSCTHRGEGHSEGEYAFPSLLQLDSYRNFFIERVSSCLFAWSLAMLVSPLLALIVTLLPTPDSRPNLIEC